MAQNNNNSRQSGKGKGWFGDSAGHAAAGRKGGKARGRNRSSSNNIQNNG